MGTFSVWWRITNVECYTPIYTVRGDETNYEGQQHWKEKENLIQTLYQYCDIVGLNLLSKERF